MKPFYSDSKVTVLNGHVITGLQGLPSESVHCVVLSPPYWGLRDYGLPAQVWDDWNGYCEENKDKGWHEWGEEQILQKCGTPTQAKGIFKGRNLEGIQSGKTLHQGQFCKRCIAWRGSLGLEPTPELYIQHVVQVFREIWRVLRKDGTVWLNLGDSYATSMFSHKYPRNITQSQNNWENTKLESRKSHLGNIEVPRNPSGLKPKDLCGIPWRVALALQADGWWLRSDIIWAKPNPMPESVTDRPTRSHEYVFLLTKSAKYFYDADAVREETQSSAGNRKVFRGHGDYTTQGKSAAKYGLERQGNEIQGNDGNPAGRNLRSVWQIEEENDHLLAELEIAIEEGIVTKEQVLALLPKRDNLKSVWQIPTQPFPQSHFAVFPEKLVEPCIKAGTSEKGCCPECGAPWVRVVEKRVPKLRDVKSEYPGDHTIATRKYKHNETGPESKTIGWRPSCDCQMRGGGIPCTVLDPFGGSGRTAIVAKKLGRKAIIIELKPEYCEMPLDELRQENIF